MDNKKIELDYMSDISSNITCIIEEMDLTKLSKTELLEKCEEYGITKCKSKKKSELIDLITAKIKLKENDLLIGDNETENDDDSCTNSDESIKLNNHIPDEEYIDNKNEDSKIINSGLKYIDLFCGIGGFHQALTNVVPTSSCVLASDIDEKARNTYEINHKLKPLGDIKKIDIAKIPTFNLICGGFPCQAFSIAQWKDKKAFDDWSLEEKQQLLEIYLIISKKESYIFDYQFI